MSEPRESQRLSLDTGVTGARVEEARYRAEFGKTLIYAFVAGLAFIGCLFALQMVLMAFGARQALTVDDLVKILTTFGAIIGPPLGFVISYYFKEREGG